MKHAQSSPAPAKRSAPKVGAKGPSRVAGSGPSPDGREAQIRLTAYSLYLARGGAEGHDLEDWLQAEAVVDRDGTPRAA